MFRFIWYYASEYIVTLSILALILIAFTVKSCKQHIPSINKVDQLIQLNHFELQIREYREGSASAYEPTHIQRFVVNQSSSPFISIDGAQAPFDSQAKQQFKELLKTCIHDHQPARKILAKGSTMDYDYRFISKGKDFVLKPISSKNCQMLAHRLHCSLQFQLPKDQKLQTVYCSTFSEEQ